MIKMSRMSKFVIEGNIVIINTSIIEKTDRSGSLIIMFYSMKRIRLRLNILEQDSPDCFELTEVRLSRPILFYRFEPLFFRLPLCYRALHHFSNGSVPFFKCCLIRWQIRARFLLKIVVIIFNRNSILLVNLSWTIRASAVIRAIHRVS